jgi:hydroxymethylglutaryl-CoA reductase
METIIAGFSKLSKQEKIDWIAKRYFSNPDDAIALIQSYWNTDKKLQQLHDEFIENTITNFYLPFGVVPNVLINNKYFTVPMVIEESSVVAAASKSAKFWAERGGFKTSVLSTQKVGQVHFFSKASFEVLNSLFEQSLPKLLEDTRPFTQNMQKRGGGILQIQLVDRTQALEDYYQLHATFETKDSMGANFINTCLEQLAKTFGAFCNNSGLLSTDQFVQINMSILSNYVTNCIVRAEVSCPITDLKEKNIPDPEAFAQKFYKAVRIAEVETYRAVTHNKGIMNGIDAVVLATGNDFRAVEAGAHAYAARSGQYSSLSHCELREGQFHFWLEIPLALGTVGGLTGLHPMVKLALQMLENPSAHQLMEITAAIGLAQNFAALRSLTTSGIQEGHMKMHLNNILNQHHATKAERNKVLEYFSNNAISHSSVVGFLEQLRTEIA